MKEVVVLSGRGGAGKTSLVGCLAALALSGANLALLVIEPNLSGVDDLGRVLGVCRRCDIPALFCINKYDLNEDNTRRIGRYCLGQEVEVAARIPFDNVFTGAPGQGRPVVAYSPDRGTREMESLWRGITHTLDAWDGG